MTPRPTRIVLQVFDLKVINGACGQCGPRHGLQHGVQRNAAQRGLRRGRGEGRRPRHLEEHSPGLLTWKTRKQSAKQSAKPATKPAAKPATPRPTTRSCTPPSSSRTGAPTGGKTCQTSHQVQVQRRNEEAWHRTVDGSPCVACRTRVPTEVWLEAGREGLSEGKCFAVAFVILVLEYVSVPLRVQYSIYSCMLWLLFLVVHLVYVCAYSIYSCMLWLLLSNAFDVRGLLSLVLFTV